MPFVAQGEALADLSLLLPCEDVIQVVMTGERAVGIVRAARLLGKTAVVILDEGWQFLCD